jgi:glycogen(starch) synthase
MLGWEYPPNISGGLGIACHGLAEALKDEGVKITFVVPHLSGAEAETRISLVSAASISISVPLTAVKDRTTLDGEAATYSDSVASRIIQIESTLSPYNLAHLKDELSLLEHWSHALRGHSDGASNGPEAETVRMDSGSVTTAPYPFIGGYGPRLLEEVHRYAQVIEQVAKSTEFDIIHAHDWMTFPAGIAASEVSGKPLIVHFHATEFDRAGDSGSKAVYEIEESAIRRCMHIIVVSNWTSKLIRTRYKADQSKVHVVHNGIVRSEKSYTRSKPPLGDNLVTFLGRITFQKGPEYFIRAAQKVLTRFPNCHFVMAGAGDALPRMIGLVARLGLSSRIHFTGFLNREEIETLLSLSSVYVMPSVSEPFGLTPLEAIQAGVPVIISKQSGVAEIMNHVLKVDFWNTDEMADAIIGVINHRSLAETLSSNAKKDLESISWHLAAKKIKHLYYEALKQAE